MCPLNSFEKQESASVEENAKFRGISKPQSHVGTPVAARRDRPPSDTRLVNRTRHPEPRCCIALANHSGLEVGDKRPAYRDESVNF